VQRGSGCCLGKRDVHAKLGKAEDSIRDLQAELQARSGELELIAGRVHISLQDQEVELRNIQSAVFRLEEHSLWMCTRPSLQIMVTCCLKQLSSYFLRQGHAQTFDSVCVACCKAGYLLACTVRQRVSIHSFLCGLFAAHMWL